MRLHFLVEAFAGAFDLSRHVFVDNGIIGLIVFIGFLGLVDFPVEGEDGRPSLGQVGQMSLVEAFLGLGLINLILLFKYHRVCWVQLTLG